MIDIKSVKAELSRPTMFVFFTAPEKVTKKDGSIVEKNHRYTMNANNGKVYQKNHEPLTNPRTKWLSVKNYSHRAYEINDEGRYMDPHTAIVEWQYVPKYDVIALVQWVVRCDEIYSNNLFINNGMPSCGIVAVKKDPDALFQWAVPEDNVFPANIIVIDKEKNILCEQDLTWRHSWIRSFPDIIRNASDIRYTDGWEVCGQYFGKVFLGKNTYGIPNNPENISIFLRTKQPTARKGPKQNKVDQLSAIELSSYPDSINTPDGTIYLDSLDCFCYVARVNDEWAVVRWFQRESYNSHVHMETYRLYVNKNEHLYCRNDGNDKFVYFGGKLSATTFDSDATFLETENVFDGTMLEYFNEIYKEIDTANMKSKALFMLVNYPEFEKFWKAGLKDLCKNYLNLRWGRSWKDYLNPILGHIEPKGKSLHAVLGVNKYQLEKCSNDKDVQIADLKRVFGTDDLRDFDNESFDVVFNFVSLVSKTFQNNSGAWTLRSRSYALHYNGIRALELTSTTYSPRTMLNIIPCLTSIAGQTVIVTPRRYYGYAQHNESDALSVYCDFVQMVATVNGASRIKPYFKTKEELADMHNILVDVLNADEANARRLQEAALAEQFKTRAEIWKRWEYDKNDKYIVVSPVAPIDLAQEGIELRHCVRSYIPKVAAGQTNIVFIREKERPDVPFFTVEILNNNTVRQIHGACNRNVSSEAGLEAFVKEWAKAVKVKAVGYNNVLA